MVFKRKKKLTAFKNLKALFFPERGASTRKAKAICRACTVQDECLEYAVQNSEKFGIWGGLSERERRRVKRQREAEFDIREVG